MDLTVKYGVAKANMKAVIGDKKMNNYTDFMCDLEKMRDFIKLSKEEFLFSYSYLTEEEYDLTACRVLSVLIREGAK